MSTFEPVVSSPQFRSGERRMHLTVKLYTFDESTADVAAVS